MKVTTMNEITVHSMNQQKKNKKNTNMETQSYKFLIYFINLFISMGNVNDDIKIIYLCLINYIQMPSAAVNYMQSLDYFLL